MSKPEDEVVFCPRCGHSVMGGRFGAVLAIGRDDCGTTVQVISLTEWREIADQSNLKLTSAGRRALREQS